MRGARRARRYFAHECVIFLPAGTSPAARWAVPIPNILTVNFANLAVRKRSLHRRERQERDVWAWDLVVFFNSPCATVRDIKTSLCEIMYHANGMMMFVFFFGAQRKEPQRLSHRIIHAILAASRQLGRPISTMLGVSWRPLRPLRRIRVIICTAKSAKSAKTGRGVMSYFFNSLRGSVRDIKTSLCDIMFHAVGMMMLVVFFWRAEKKSHRGFGIAPISRYWPHHDNWAGPYPIGLTFLGVLRALRGESGYLFAPRRAPRARRLGAALFRIC